mmetsp:Transcript_13098/g.28694  ORF Transcript_13098/g.28694 Transcript_13098/m.28694 type:complete len:213 (+) Transcript_13098:73-711(+)
MKHESQQPRYNKREALPANKSTSLLLKTRINAAANNRRLCFTRLSTPFSSALLIALSPLLNSVVCFSPSASLDAIPAVLSSSLPFFFNSLFFVSSIAICCTCFRRTVSSSGSTIGTSAVSYSSFSAACSNAISSPRIIRSAVSANIDAAPTGTVDSSSSSTSAKACAAAKDADAAALATLIDNISCPPIVAALASLSIQSICSSAFSSSTFV